MHFREVNNKLKQLKANVYWCSKALQFVDVSDELYQTRVRNYFKAQQALEVFRNTTIAQLKG